MQGHLGPRDLCLNKLSKGPLGMQCYIPNLKHLIKVFLKKIFEYFSMEEYFSKYFYGSNQGPLARGHLGPWDLGLNKLGKGVPGNAIYHITST